MLGEVLSLYEEKKTVAKLRRTQERCRPLPVTAAPVMAKTRTDQHRALSQGLLGRTMGATSRSFTD